MKTFMLVGDVSDNAGPSNVHRELIAHWPAEEELLVPRWSNAVSKLISVVVASMRCDVLLTTGVGRLGAIAWEIARKRNVPVIVLVHGYLPYENEVNKLGYSPDFVQEWRKVLHDADIVATNSEFHAACLRTAEPDIADRVRWFNLGVERFTPREHASHGDGITVAVSGGTRPIKANEVVAQAVALLQEQGHRVNLLVFGRGYSANAKLEEDIRTCSGRMMGQVTLNEFLDILARTDVFVMNSRRESFGMSAIDALRGAHPFSFRATAGLRAFSRSRRGTSFPIARTRARSRERFCISYRSPTPSGCTTPWTLTCWDGTFRLVAFVKSAARRLLPHQPEKHEAR